MPIDLPLPSSTAPGRAVKRSGIRQGASSSSAFLLRGTTGLLWFALVVVSGPLAWKTMLAMGVGVGWQRQRRGRPNTTTGNDEHLIADMIPAAELPLPVSRQELASSFGLEEKALFRVRHARICEVSHSADGTILAIQTIPVDPPVSRPPLHAHPVG